MFGIGPMELVLILVVALLVFGPKRLPELARTLGRGMGEFRKASNDLRQSLALDDLQNDLREGLSGENSIHRPAQAGDSLPDPEKAPAEDAADAAETETPDAVEAAEAADSSASAEAPKTPHPGELPLDNDYEHNDVSHDPESADAAAPQNAEPSASAEAAESPLSMGDSELGNIPVSRPSVGKTASSPGKTDSERG